MIDEAPILKLVRDEAGGGWRISASATGDDPIFLPSLSQAARNFPADHPIVGIVSAAIFATAVHRTGGWKTVDEARAAAEATAPSLEWAGALLWKDEDEGKAALRAARVATLEAVVAENWPRVRTAAGLSEHVKAEVDDEGPVKLTLVLPGETTENDPPAEVLDKALDDLVGALTVLGYAFELRPGIGVVLVHWDRSLYGRDEG